MDIFNKSTIVIVFIIVNTTFSTIVIVKFSLLLSPKNDVKLHMRYSIQTDAEDGNPFSLENTKAGKSLVISMFVLA